MSNWKDSNIKRVESPDRSDFFNRTDPDNLFDDLNDRFRNNFDFDHEFFENDPARFDPDEHDQRFDNRATFPRREHFVHHPTRRFPSHIDRDMSPSSSPNVHFKPEHKKSYNPSDAESIPIRVIHEHSKYGPRHTMELPAAASCKLSPRLERAQSESPKSFEHKIRKQQRSCDSIPEQAYVSYTEFPTKDSVRISNSSSAPSMPSPPQRSNSSSTPLTPPRKYSPGNPGKVRLIPIIVEGREEPCNIRRDSAGSCTPTLRKPSDFYPPTVQKERPDNDPIYYEPTTPQGPPPGPIAMGCSPLLYSKETSPKAFIEPTSPLPPPPGPIALPYTYSPISKVTDVVDDAPCKSTPCFQFQEADTSVMTKLQDIKEYMLVISSHIKQFSVDGGQFHSIILDLINLFDHGAMRAAFEDGSKITEEEYIYLDEMLTRHLLLLDNLEVSGREDVRILRREVIRSINRCLTLLDSFRSSNSISKQNKQSHENNSTASLTTTQAQVHAPPQ